MRTIILIAVCVVTLVIAYLSLIGMNDKLESRSTGNIVKFSDAAVAAQSTGLQHEFSPFPNVTIRLKGIFAGKGGLKQEELNMRVELIGDHRRRLFDPPEYFVCSKTRMKALIQEQLVQVTGDEALELKELRLGYLSNNRE